MTGNAHRYEFTATTAQEAHNLLEAAQQLLDAHLKLLAPGAPYINSELRERTPVHLAITLDLADANEVATLNQSLRSEASSNT